MKYSEEELVKGLKSKDKSYFDYLYENYSGAIFGIIIGIIKDNNDAEDALQDVFVKFWRRIDQYDASKGRLYTWMLNVTRNSCIDKLRSKTFNKGSKTQSLDNSVNAIGSQFSEEQKIDHIGMQPAIEQLEPNYRILVDMVYFQGYTQADVAEELDIPLGTVKTRLRKAIMDLRKKLVSHD